MSSLKELEACGQSAWLDFLDHSFIESGKLHKLVERDGLKGVTSNPSILEKAIGETNQYDTALKELLAQGDLSVSEIYERLIIPDIRTAADVMSPVYESTKRRDGYISLECSPYLANDVEATVAEGLRLWRATARPNLMLKAPATPSGLQAIRKLIGLGLNVNATLIFSVSKYEQVVEAYFSGLEDLLLTGGDVSTVCSVASMFVGRIDRAIDDRLEKSGDKELANGLCGRAAIASAKLAYARYKALFSGARWERLANFGAKTQRLLWASTTNKNAAYKDTIYVEALIGRDTVTTIAPSTMKAFMEHGEAKPDRIEQDLEGAHAVPLELRRHGISLEEACDELVEDGVQQFADAFDQMFGEIGRRRRIFLEGPRPRMEIAPGSPEMRSAFEQESEIWRKEGRVRRLWAGDSSLWSGNDENKWLGWLHILEAEFFDIDKLQAFAKTVSLNRFSDIVLLGMGGSSLGPEVLGETFGPQSGSPRFHMLDSTDPAQIRSVEESIDLPTTLFIISSKSGATLEPNIFLDYFMHRVALVRGEDVAGANFIAITDPRSPLDQRAKALRFSNILYGVPSIGGRYSVLSNFGMAPAAITGIDIKRLRDTARQMQRSCGPDMPPTENPGVQLGIAIGVAAMRFRRDKLTIVASPGIADLGAWLEQLLAESTGKQGRGLVPLNGEPLDSPLVYGDDRIFVYLGLDGQEDISEVRALEALEQSGHPIIRIRVKDILHIGQEFFRWEIAAAVASAIIGVDPFNQPDVEASKDKTRELTTQYEKSRSLHEEEPIFSENGLALFADPRNAAAIGDHNTLFGYLQSYFTRTSSAAGDYVALLAYIERNKANTQALTLMRVQIRGLTHAATCVGFGPRFQHSTGQLYKGGPNSGVFLQITCDDPHDIEVPGHAYSFGVVKAAQARGDLDVLVERGRRALRIHLSDVDTGLLHLSQAITLACA